MDSTRTDGATDTLAGQRVVVVGAGISGLTSAFHLQRLGAEVLVLEKAQKVGGRMSTVEHDGFRIDTGACFLMSCYREMVQLIDLAGLRAQTLPTSDLLGFLREGHIHRIHTSARREWARSPLLGLRSKLALAHPIAKVLRHHGALRWSDLSGAGPLDSEDVASYARRHLPGEAFEYLFDPLHETLNLAPSDQVSALELFFYLAHFPGTRFFNGRRGIDFLPRGLAAQVPVTVDAEVTSVTERRDEVTVTWRRPGQAERTETASAAVVVLPAPLVSAIHPGLSRPPARATTAPQYGIGVYSMVPRATPLLIASTLRAHGQLLDLCLRHEGLPYLYGAHHPLGDVLRRCFDAQDLDQLTALRDTYSLEALPHLTEPICPVPARSIQE
ncbi:protoporphyrinogen/coproporphyrinogen oxidase [Streptomyces sp. NPDC059009]|uniref:protoporphyrinogen/coproporphyrinogen oxidase n=1 Tax=Streptomyces sp. NPDC059009 TaxID=3346694 RepID=UPI0036A02684